MVKNVSEVRRSEFQSIVVLAEVTKSFHDLSFESLPQRVFIAMLRTFSSLQERYNEVMPDGKERF
jgi:hypothetical protein